MLTIQALLRLATGELLVADEIEATLTLNAQGELADVVMKHPVPDFRTGKRVIMWRPVSVWDRTDATALALKASARMFPATDEGQEALESATAKAA